MEETTAWLLYKKGKKVGLVEEKFEFSSIEAHEVLIEPLFGCWEGNMDHALRYDPVDICQERNEEKVVLGNGGVVRVLKIGTEVSNFKKNDICMLFSTGIPDKYGYPIKVLGYDMKGSIGLLSKRSKVPQHCLIKLPENNGYSLQQWAAFSARFVTAWANWKMAYSAYQLQRPVKSNEVPFIFAWGGGVSFAQALLAKYYGFDVAMIASHPERLDMLKSFGIIPIDRRKYQALNFNEEKYNFDKSYKREYTASVNMFKKDVTSFSPSKDVSIIFDHLGGDNFRTTLRLLGREGVVATAGWKIGMKLSYIRANSCINRQFFIHTHYANLMECIESINFSINNNWNAPINNDYYTWDKIPILADDYSKERIISYFPIYEVNPI